METFAGGPRFWAEYLGMIVSEKMKSKEASSYRWKGTSHS